MKLEESIRVCFTKYATFEGRASRSEFWWFMLFLVLVSTACGIFSSMLSMVFTLATLVPAIAVTTRRLHDVDKSGWMQLIGLIPIVGWSLVIVRLCQAGKGPNRFGPAPADASPRVNQRELSRRLIKVFRPGTSQIRVMIEGISHRTSFQPNQLFQRQSSAAG